MAKSKEPGVTKQAEPQSAAAEPKQSKRTEAQSIIAELRESSTRLMIGAELTLRHICTYAVHDGGYCITLCPDDEAVLRAAGLGALVDDQLQMRRELGRIQREEGLRARANTAENYAAAQKRASEASEAESARGPALEREIEKLQAQRDALLEAVAESEAAVAEMTEARRELRGWPPRFIQGHVDYRKRKAQQKYGEQLTTLRQRIEMIERVISTNPKTDVQLARSVARAAGRFDLSGPPQVPEELWSRWSAELMRELPDLEAREHELQTASNAEMAAAEKPIDAFVEAVVAAPDWLEGFTLPAAEAA